MKAYITADLFRVVAMFISTEKTRYYLNGVYVEPHPVKGLLLTATDGHRLFNAWDEHGEMTGDSGIVQLPKDMLKACQSKNTHRATGRKTALYIEDGKPQVFTFDRWSDDMTPRQVVAAGDLMASSRECCLIDGTFPDWRRVVPADVEGGSPGAYSAKYLAAYEKALKALNDYYGTNNVGVTVCGQIGSPALVRFGFPTVFGVLMSMRFEADTIGQRPVYLDAQPYPEPKVAVSALDSDTRYPYTADDAAWRFTITVTHSPITAATRRTFKFNTKPQAARAYNRILSGLHARGMAKDCEPIWPHYDLKPDAVKAIEERAKRIKEAREAFEDAEPIDLARPWQRHSIPIEYPSLAEHAFLGLPAISEGRAMQSLYQRAA